MGKKMGSQNVIWRVLMHDYVELKFRLRKKHEIEQVMRYLNLASTKPYVSEKMMFCHAYFKTTFNENERNFSFFRNKHVNRLRTTTTYQHSITQEKHYNDLIE